MSAVIGLYYASAALLIAAGAPKLVRPDSMALAMRDVGLPGSRTVARLVAGAEVVVGAGAVLVGGRYWAVAVAALYAGFCVFLAVALRAGTESGCGCFVGDDAPPSVLHLVLDASFAAVAAFVSVTGSPSYLHRLNVDAVSAGELGIMCCVVAWVAYLLLSRLPTVAPSRLAADAEVPA